MNPELIVIAAIAAVLVTVAVAAIVFERRHRYRMEAVQAAAEAARVEQQAEVADAANLRAWVEAQTKVDWSKLRREPDPPPPAPPEPPPVQSAQRKRRTLKGQAPRHRIDVNHPLIKVINKWTAYHRSNVVVPTEILADDIIYRETEYEGSYLYTFIRDGVALGFMRLIRETNRQQGTKVAYEYFPDKVPLKPLPRRVSAPEPAPEPMPAHKTGPLSQELTRFLLDRTSTTHETPEQLLSAAFTHLQGRYPVTLIDAEFYHTLQLLMDRQFIFTSQRSGRCFRNPACERTAENV